LLEFRDDAEKEAHDSFKRWRRANNDGFFVNCKSGKSVTLHHALCPHSGDTDWEKGKWGSLTRNRKICSDTREELVDCHSDSLSGDSFFGIGIGPTYGASTLSIGANVPD